MSNIVSNRTSRCMVVSTLTCAVMLFFLVMFQSLVSTSITSAMKENLSSERETSSDYDAMSGALQYFKSQLRETRKSLDKLWCKTQNVMSSGGFCVSEESLYQGGNQVFDPPLCNHIEEYVGHSSVGDLGAGLGWYGMCLLKLKETPYLVNTQLKKQIMDHYWKTWGQEPYGPRVIKSWNGYDGAGNIDELTGNFIKQVDLSAANLDLGRKFDWVLSLEVGEHIPAINEKNFIDNITKHACKGVILSWAVEGQGGHHHVNNHNNDYVKARMAERGFQNDLETEKKFREDAKLGWFRNTVMVFKLKNPKDCENE